MKNKILNDYKHIGTIFYSQIQIGKIMKEVKIVFFHPQVVTWVFSVMMEIMKTIRQKWGIIFSSYDRNMNKLSGCFFVFFYFTWSPLLVTQWYSRIWYKMGHL